MRKLRFWGFLPAFCLLALPLLAANKMMLEDVGVAKIGNNVEIPLTLEAEDEIQGLVAAFQWDGTKGVGQNLVLGAVLDTADTVVTNIMGDFMVLGVVMDSDGLPDDPADPASLNEIIVPGTYVVATAVIECLADSAGPVPVEFVDGAHPAATGGPLMENIVVVEGLSIGVNEGLLLDDGEFGCVDPVHSMYVDSANSNSETGGAIIRLDVGPGAGVEGLVIALEHNPAIATLAAADIVVGADAAAADFVSTEAFATGGTMGLVMDLVDPQPSPPVLEGAGLHVATFGYECVTIPATGSIDMDVKFVDDVYGSPAKENVIVIGGLSVSDDHPTTPLFLQDGTFSCVPETCVATGPEGILYGNCQDGKDNDCDDLTDIDDPDCQVDVQQQFLCGTREQDPVFGIPTPQQTVSTDGETEICFYIMNPEDNSVGTIPQFDHIQGFSMVLSYCCELEATPILDISGTILEAIGAEYVSAQADNDPNDGDGCELIIGVLVDALPPFDGATIPPSDKAQLMGCVTFAPKDPEACGTCCPVEFTDGLDGIGKVPINNLISVENISVSMLASAVDCEICIVGEPCFFRGDCNFSGNSGSDGTLAVDIADAAMVVSFLFAPGLYKPQPPCLDACDCNDDGRIDLADAVCILRYLFQQGDFPPEPGPGLRETPEGEVEPTPCGNDPTLDLLDCAGGDGCPEPDTP